MKKKYILLFFSTLFLWSCEEDVVLNLGKIQKRLVVEAKVSNSLPMATVILSYSQDFYAVPDHQHIKNAQVELIADDGETEILTCNSDTVFVSKTIQPQYGMNYKLKVKVDDQDFEVNTKLPPLVPITNVVMVPNPFYQNKDSLNAFVNVADQVGVDNFFRLSVRKIKDVPTGEYYLLDDSFGKDGLISMPVYYKNFKNGDTIVVELFNLTPEIYQYYSGLSENLSGSFNSIAPGNPVSNMPDEVFGYFAGYSVDRDTIMVGALPF